MDKSNAPSQGAGTSSDIHTRCCVVGGGPAGIMLGLLLARAGVEVVVLEKHGDFLRDFRGDTIHPSTLGVIHELGWLDELLARPHQEIRELSGQVGDDLLAIADFTHLPTRCGFVALMPQWDFLNFLVEKARAYPTFRLEMEAEAQDLVEEGGRIVGVRAQGRRGVFEVRADLTVGADGRRSIVRARAGLPLVDLDAPMDVMWMRISRREDDPAPTFGHVEPGRILVMLNRKEYWQCAYVIAKGSAETMRREDISTFRDEIARLSPFLRDRVGELRSWDDVHLLTVAVDRLRSGRGPDSCASVTPLMRCRRSVASGSTSRSRTPLPPPTSSARASSRARRQSASSTPCARGGSFPRARPRGCKSPSRTASSGASWTRRRS